MFPGITHTYYCWICGNAVDLRTSKTDEYGMAVHENCYVAKTALATEASRLTEKTSRLSRHWPAALPLHKTRVSNLNRVLPAIGATGLIIAAVSLAALFNERAKFQSDSAELQAQVRMPADTARKVHPVEGSDLKELFSNAGRRAELLSAIYALQQRDVVWRVGGTSPKQGFDSPSFAIFVLENHSLVPKGSMSQIHHDVGDEQRLLRTLLKTESSPSVGDVVFYATGLTMFYYKDRLGRPFVMGMTPVGILCLDPDFAQIVGYGAVPYPAVKS